MILISTWPRRALSHALSRICLMNNESMLNVTREGPSEKVNGDVKHEETVRGSV